MNSRMDRYNNEITETRSTSRVNKNTSLYDDIKRSELSRVSANSNIKVIEGNHKTIDLNKIRKYIAENNKVQTERRNTLVLPVKEEIREEKKEEKKVYDINSVLEKARQSRELDYENERYKKLRLEEDDILKRIKSYEESKLKEEEEKEDLELNTGERTLIDLINTVTVHKGDINLLEELTGKDGEEVTAPIKEEQQKNDILKEIEIKKIETEKEKTQELVNLKQKINDIDKSFYTNSMSFSKEDFEGFEELEKSVKKNNVLTTIGIIMLCIVVLGTLVVIANYVFNLGLF